MSRLDTLITIGAIDLNIAFPYLQSQNDLEFAKRLVDETGEDSIYAACTTLWVELFHYAFRRFGHLGTTTCLDECLIILCRMRKLTTALKYKQVQIAHQILFTPGFRYEIYHINECFDNFAFTLAKYIMSHGKRRYTGFTKNALLHKCIRVSDRIVEFCFREGFKDERLEFTQNFNRVLKNKQINTQIVLSRNKHSAHAYCMFNICGQFVCKDVCSFTSRFVAFYYDKNDNPYGDDDDYESR